MKVKVGLVGLGEHWETRHRPALLALSDRFDIRAVSCEVAQKANQVAKDFNAVPMDGFRAMVERPDIEAVLSLGPDWVGHLPMLAACEAGKAVYSAVALEISPDQATQVKERVDRSGVAFMAEFSRRHAAATVRLKELMATRLGPPQLIFCHQRISPTLSPTGKGVMNGRLRNHRRTEIMEMFDWVCYLCGRSPNSVWSVLDPNCPEVDSTDYQVVSLEFGEQPAKKMPPVLAQVSLGSYIPAQWQDAIAFRRPASIQVRCANGIAFLDLPSSLIWFDSSGQHSETLDYERPLGEQLLTQFYRAIVSLIRVSSDLNDAYRAMQIMDACRRSAASGQRVSFVDQADAAWDSCPRVKISRTGA